MPRIPLAQAVDEYLSWLELDRHAAEGTIAEFAENADVRSIARIDRDVLRAYQRRLARLRTGPEGSRRPLAVSTRARQLVALRSFLRFCAREEWLPGDLGATIDVPPLPERLPRPLDADHRDLLPRGAARPRAHPLPPLYRLPDQRGAPPRRRGLEPTAHAGDRQGRPGADGHRDRPGAPGRRGVPRRPRRPLPPPSSSASPKGPREAREPAHRRRARHVCRELARRLGDPGVPAPPAAAHAGDPPPSERSCSGCIIQ